MISVFSENFDKNMLAADEIWKVVGSSGIGQRVGEAVGRAGSE